MRNDGLLTCDVCGNLIQKHKDLFKIKQYHDGVQQVYFKCPYCRHKYICYYTDSEIRGLQELQRFEKSTEQLKRRKMEISYLMQDLRIRMEVYKNEQN